MSYFSDANLSPIALPIELIPLLIIPLTVPVALPTNWLIPWETSFDAIPPSVPLLPASAALYTGPPCAKEFTSILGPVNLAYGKAAN